MVFGLIKRVRKGVQSAWNLAEGEIKQIKNQNALVGCCGVGYMVGVADYNPNEHRTLDEAYDAEERQGTLDTIASIPALDSFDDSDITQAYNEASKFYATPIPNMPGAATKAQGDKKTLDFLKQFAGTEHADPLMDAACMITWGDGKIDQGEVEALDKIGQALGIHNVQEYKDKFAISVTG